MDKMFVSPPPQNSYIETNAPALNMMLFVGGTFGRSLGHESGALTNGIKETQKAPLSLPSREDTAKRLHL